MPILTWTPFTDKYGRKAQRLTSNGHTQGMVVRLPKAYRDQYPGQNFLANDWGLIGTNAQGVTYHATLAQAKAALEFGR